MIPSKYIERRSKVARYIVGAIVATLTLPFFAIGFVAGCVYVATVAGFVMVEDFRNWIF